MTPLEIIFAGSGEFGLPALRALLDAGHRIVRVVSQPDRPAGRGRHLTPNPIARFALDQKLPLDRTDNINALPLPPADVMLVIAFGQKIDRRQVDHPRLGSINLHASLLPKYRGAAPINWSIWRGERETGNSVIRLAERMDAGAMLAQSRLSIGETETAGELHDRLAVDGAPLVLGVLQQLAAGTSIERPQDDSHATLAPKLSRASTQIDWSGPADEIANQIRALHPWPGCHVTLVDSAGQETLCMTLVRAMARESSHSDAAPGHILADGCVAAGRGAVEILQCQPQGKRIMSMEEFRNGHPWRAGMTLR